MQDRYKPIKISVAAAGVEFLFGLGVVVLGIIALAGTYTTILSLAALLIVGVTGLFTGAAVTSRMISVFQRHSAV